jgi:hypothetical protein
MLEEFDFMNSSSRCLQDETCYCNAQAVAQYAPLESELIAVYQLSVGNLTLDCIGSVGKCNFGTTFNTISVLLFDQDSIVAFELFTYVIVTSFQDTVNEELCTNEESCNQLFQYVQDVYARIDFIFDDDDLNKTINSQERQLHQRAGRRRTLISPSKRQASRWCELNAFQPTIQWLMYQQLVHLIADPQTTTMHQLPPRTKVICCDTPF